MAVSQETFTIIGVGIALAGIIFASNGRLGDRIDRVETRLAAVEKETARTGGLLEGLGLTGQVPHLTPGADGE